MKGNFIQGALFFWEGVRLIFTPGLRRYIIWPVIINIFLFALVFVGSAWYLFNELTAWVSDYPRWVIILIGWLFWLLYVALSLLIGAFIFSITTNIIASPFYGILAEKVEQQFHPNTVFASFSITRILAREGLKLLYFLPWLIVCGLLFLFPPLWPIMPFILFFLFAWFAAIQYADYCPDNRGIPFKTALGILKEHPLTALGFGLTVSIAMTIPGANLFVPPAAVAGGCSLWLFIEKGTHKRNAVSQVR